MKTLLPPSALSTLLLAALVGSLRGQADEMAPGLQPPSPASGGGDWSSFGATHNTWVLQGNAIQDNQLLGVVRVGGRLYVSGGNNGTHPNKLYVVDDASGALLAAIDQPTTSAWGMRDLATDGRYVYGGDESRLIQVFDTHTNSFIAPIDVTTAAAAAGIGTVRALAWVKGLPNMSAPGFVFGDWSGTLAFVDLNGSLVQTVPNVFTTLYGLSYVPWIGMLFAAAQTMPGGPSSVVYCAAINPVDGQVLPGNDFFGTSTIGGIAGGVELDWSFDDAKLLMVVLHQATQDSVASYEIGLLSRFETGTPSCGSDQPIAFPRTMPDIGNQAFGINMFSYAPSGIALALIGFSDTSYGGLPLPLALDSLGYSGCSLLVSIDITAAAVIDPFGRATTPLPLPPVLAFVGTNLYAQWVTLTPTDNASFGSKLKLWARGRALKNGVQQLVYGTMCVTQFNAVQVYCLANTSTDAQMRACVLNIIDDPTSMAVCSPAEKKFFRKAYE